MHEPLRAVIQDATSLRGKWEWRSLAARTKSSWHNSMNVLGTTCAALKALAIVQMRALPIRTWPGRQQRMQPRVQP